MVKTKQHCGFHSRPAGGQCRTRWVSACLHIPNLLKGEGGSASGGRRIGMYELWKKKGRRCRCKGKMSAQREQKEIVPSQAQRQCGPPTAVAYVLVFRLSSFMTIFIHLGVYHSPGDYVLTSAQLLWVCYGLLCRTWYVQLLCRRTKKRTREIDEVRLRVF